MSSAPRHSAWALREATVTRAENSRQEPAGNHPLALTFQNASASAFASVPASAFASASVPAQLPPRLRPCLCLRPDSLGATAPPLPGGTGSPASRRGRRGPQRASWGASSGSARGGRSGRVAPVGEPLRWECGIGRPSGCGWRRRRPGCLGEGSPLLPPCAGSGAWQGQRRACIRGLGAPGWSGNCGNCGTCRPGYPRGREAASASSSARRFTVTCLALASPASRRFRG